ncbi:MAG: hypothetical protein WC587_03500 [Candidatus Paceibacterota bacterium]
MAKKITIEDLALMVQRGFDETAKKFDETAKKAGVDKSFDDVNKRFDGVDKRFDNIDGQLHEIRKDMSEIRKNVVYRDEFDKLMFEFGDLMARVKYLEQKSGIQSGK